MIVCVCVYAHTHLYTHMHAYTYIRTHKYIDMTKTTFKYNSVVCTIRLRLDNWMLIVQYLNIYMIQNT